MFSQGLAVLLSLQHQMPFSRIFSFWRRCEERVDDKIFALLQLVFRMCRSRHADPRARAVDPQHGSLCKFSYYPRAAEAFLQSTAAGKNPKAKTTDTRECRDRLGGEFEDLGVLFLVASAIWFR